MKGIYIKMKLNVLELFSGSGTLAQEIVTYCEIEYKNKLLLTMVDNIARPKK